MEQVTVLGGEVYRLLFNINWISHKNRHALLKYRQKSQEATFYVHPVDVFKYCYLFLVSEIKANLGKILKIIMWQSMPIGRSGTCKVADF